MTALLYSYLNNTSRSNTHITNLILRLLNENFGGFAGRILGGQLVTKKAIFRKLKAQGGPFKIKGYVQMGTEAVASFLWATYGQFILGIARGFKTFEELIKYAFTGSINVQHCLQLRTEDDPKTISTEDQQMVLDFMAVLLELSKSQSQPPISTQRFCSRPENRHITPLCK